MVDPELSRREILAGMAVTGTSGALVGSGTVSLFTDEETFTNNSLTGSTSIAGTVDIDVTVRPTESGSGIEFEIDLPESDTENGNLTVDNGTGGEKEAGYKNNPAYLWVRTLSCPVPTSDATEIEVKVSLRDEDGETRELDRGSVFDVFATEEGDDDFDINTGELLEAASGDACLNTGGTRTLVIDVIDIPNDASAKIELEVYAEQCRYASDDGQLENPWADAKDLVSRSTCCVPCESGDELLEKWEFVENETECKFKLETDENKGDDPYIGDGKENENFQSKTGEDCDPISVTFETDYCDGEILYAKVKAGGTTIVQEIEVTDGTVTVTNGNTGKGISNIEFYCEDPS